MAQDPDKLLQRLVDAMASELRRVRANARGPIGRDKDGNIIPCGVCPTCERDFGMSDAERKFLIEAGKLMSSIAFGARKLFADRALKALSEGQLEALGEMLEAKDKGGGWLPE